MNKDRQKYLQLMAEQFDTVEDLCTEITRIRAQLSLPKGTEHFMSDIHGEYEAFCHIMNNCSGVIREKVDLWLGDRLTHEEADALCTLIYYPEAILKQMHAEGRDPRGLVPGAGGAPGHAGAAAVLQVHPGQGAPGHAGKMGLYPGRIDALPERRKRRRHRAGGQPAAVSSRAGGHA